MATTAELPADVRPALERLQELAARAQQGDRSVLPELRRALDADPRVWQQAGDLAAHAQAAWLSLLAGKDLLLHESVKRQAEAMREELAGPSPSRLEALLVERIVACWLQTMYADCIYAQARAPEATAAVLRELMRRQESAQKRYLASIKQLALVRKLLKPTPSPLEIATRIQAEAAAPPFRRKAAPVAVG
jgi:hypothetical protein